MRHIGRAGIGSYCDRESGNAMFFVLVLLVLMLGFTAAQVVVQQANLKQSNFFLAQSGLHQYAESGLAIAFHDFEVGATGAAGNIGTESWKEVDSEKEQVG